MDQRREMSAMLSGEPATSITSSSSVSSSASVATAPTECNEAAASIPALDIDNLLTGLSDQDLFHDQSSLCLPLPALPSSFDIDDVLQELDADKLRELEQEQPSQVAQSMAVNLSGANFAGASNINIHFNLQK